MILSEKKNTVSNDVVLSDSNNVHMLDVKLVSKPKFTDIPLYKIKIRTLEGVLLVYRKVVSYDVRDGLISFIDRRSGNLKTFSVSNCEIEPEVVKE